MSQQQSQMSSLLDSTAGDDLDAGEESGVAHHRGKSAISIGTGFCTSTTRENNTIRGHRRRDAGASFDSNPVRQSPACSSAVPDCTCALLLPFASLALLSAHRDPYPHLPLSPSLSFSSCLFSSLAAVSLLLGSISCFISARVLHLSTLATLSLLSAFIGLCLLLYLSYSANKLTFRMNEINSKCQCLVVPSITSYEHRMRPQRESADHNSLQFCVSWNPARASSFPSRRATGGIGGICVTSAVFRSTHSHRVPYIACGTSQAKEAHRLLGRCSVCPGCGHFSTNLLTFIPGHTVVPLFITVVRHSLLTLRCSSCPTCSTANDRFYSP